MNRIRIYVILFLISGGIVSVFGQSADSSKGELIVQVFGNAFSSDITSDHSRSGFQIGRAHLGYAYRFDNRFSAKIILDRGRPSTVQTITVQDSAGNDLDVNRSDAEGSYYTMALKFASLEWKANDRLKFQIGAVLQNHYITQEKFWGYRYVAPTFQDRYFHTPSGDLGLIGFYRFNDRLGFDIAIYNGEGFRKSQDDEGKLKFAGGFDWSPVRGLTTRIYYDIQQAPPGANFEPQRIYSFFCGYRLPSALRFGFEWNRSINHQFISNQNLYGYSLFSSIPIASGFAFFARMDQLMSNTLMDGSETWHRNEDGLALISGFHFTPVEGVSFSVNYQGWKSAVSDFDWSHGINLSFEFRH